MREIFFETTRQPNKTKVKIEFGENLAQQLRLLCSW